MQKFLAILLVLTVPTNAVCWSECGHHIIAVLAYMRLSEGDQSELIRVLKHHPRFDEDFQVPRNVKNTEHWLIGRAGYWPDVARRHPEWNRPTWHYELGASHVIEEIGSKLNVPERPGPLPPDATLDTQELYASQAFELCSKIFHDEKQPLADRAVALCWLLHIGADVHQPCNAGSLYVSYLFPEGDRGANSIKIKQGRNLHSFWDGLLGTKFSESDVRRRTREINEYVPDRQANWLVRIATQGGVRDLQAYYGGQRDEDEGIQTWLTESRLLAVGEEGPSWHRPGYAFVYPPQMLNSFVTMSRSASRGADVVLPEFDLSETVRVVPQDNTNDEDSEHYKVDYMEAAGKVAQVRAYMAGERLATVLAGKLAK